MTTAVIYHNPRCSKSRQSLALLQQQGVQVEVVEYLKTPPSARQLTEILGLLGLSARALMRTKEAEYSENNLADDNLSERQLIAAMVQYPKLIERPIVVANSQARIGRPPEQILEIL